MCFVQPLRNDFQRENRFDSPIDKLSKIIVDLVLFPFKLIATIFLLPLLIPLAILHSIVVISINTCILFSFFSLATLFLLTTSQIIMPIGFITLLLISSISLNSIQSQINYELRNLARNFSLF